MREIPGVYYDEERKKYFKITKDHLQSKNKKPCSSTKPSSSGAKEVYNSISKYLIAICMNIKVIVLSAN